MIARKYIKPIVFGFIGMIAMALFYFSVLYLVTSDINHPLRQFLEYKYWMSALVLGFGIQFGLFWFIKSGLHLSGAATNSAVTVGAGSSAVAMAACCAHHIFDLLPILGLTAFATVLSEYQEHFFLLGIVFNLAGIFLMFYIIKTKKCFTFKSLFKKI